MSVPNTNDGTSNPPALRCYLAMGNLADLIPSTSFVSGDTEPVLQQLKDAGFDGTQGGDVEISKKLGMGTSGGGRINAVGEAEPIVKRCQDDGVPVATVHVGWGVEDDDEIDAVVGDILEQCAKHNFPIYIETHRATITQDMWRTVQLVKRFPEVRFNGDFSHWYTGLEMPYGGMEMKLEFMAPVLDRVRFMHGRIGSSGSMQVDIGQDGVNIPNAYGRANFVDHFREMWTQSMHGFLKTAKPGDYLAFAPELLDTGAYYARKFPDAQGNMVEEGDRYQQALLYCKIARECWAEAEKRHAG